MNAKIKADDVNAKLVDMLVESYEYYLEHVPPPVAKRSLARLKALYTAEKIVPEKEIDAAQDNQDLTGLMFLTWFKKLIFDGAFAKLMKS